MSPHEPVLSGFWTWKLVGLEQGGSDEEITLLLYRGYVKQEVRPDFVPFHENLNFQLFWCENWDIFSLYMHEIYTILSTSMGCTFVWTN